MSLEDNKDVVRRFIKEVLNGGDLDRIDDLLAPDYVNRAFGVDLVGFKGMLAGLVAAVPERRYDIEELVADGDAVVARFSGEMTDTAGGTHTLRGLTYYRLAEGRIIEDDPFSSPDLAAELGALIATASA